MEICLHTQTRASWAWKTRSRGTCSTQRAHTRLTSSPLLLAQLISPSRDKWHRAAIGQRRRALPRQPSRHSIGACGTGARCGAVAACAADGRALPVVGACRHSCLRWRRRCGRGACVRCSAGVAPSADQPRLPSGQVALATVAKRCAAGCSRGLHVARGPLGCGSSVHHAPRHPGGPCPGACLGRRPHDTHSSVFAASTVPHSH